MSSCNYNGRLTRIPLVSATALFVTPYPGDTTTSGIRAFDLGQPVIDFTISDDGLIWVSVDANWSEGSPETEEKPAVTRVLKISSGEVRIMSQSQPITHNICS
jgi:tRNA (guanine-N(7)-)-methyltransferase subunit TRM82